MTKSRRIQLALTLAAALCAPSWAQYEAPRSSPAKPAAAPKKKASAKTAPKKTAKEPAEKPTQGFDKASLESYLKVRSERIKQMHKARTEFMTQETAEWNTFWNKVKEDRLLFEIRATRQRLDLFESLGSLESKDHSPSITDFEKLQGSVSKAFEAQQKQKVLDFFTQRDARSRDFALLQEKDRAEAAADAESTWQEQKASLRLAGSKAEGEAVEGEGE